MSDQDSMDDTHDHNHEDHQQPTTDGVEDSQEPDSDQEHEKVDDHLHDDIYQDSEGDPEVVLQTIEQEIGVEMADYVDESRDYNETTMDGVQIDREPTQGESTNGNEPVQDLDSLFVPEHIPPAPSVPFCQAPSANMAPPARPTAAPSTSAKSLFSRIRSMQKSNAERKTAAKNQASMPRYTADPDNETYLEAVMASITPSASTPAPAVGEDDMADRLASAEFQRQQRHYAELKRKNGSLTFREDVEWIRIKGAEKARIKKHARDRALIAEEGQEEPELFPSIRPATDDRSDDDSDAPFNLDLPALRKRPRQLMPRKEPKSMSMQEAELHSMHVALDADKDRPAKKKKKEASDQAQAAGPSSKKKPSKPRAAKVSAGKTSAKKVTKGEKKPRKNKAQTERAAKELASLFNSNVFEQQAGVDDPNQPGFRARVKADALKELIASVPLADSKVARKDINILLSATKDFNGRGAVKADGGFWKVKGMVTSLKPYQVLGTAFMRRRENGLDMPRGGLMADQMG
jgi:hypothetical protein